MKTILVYKFEAYGDTYQDVMRIARGVAEVFLEGTEGVETELMVEPKDGAEDDYLSENLQWTCYLTVAK